jgi:hypothetical protein
MTRRFILALLLLALSPALFAQQAVPAPDEFLGYTLGERFTPWPRIVDYFNELAKRSSLVSIEKFGETYEHRPLMLVTITSAKNRASLEQIRQNVASLGDDATTPAHAAEITKSSPAVVWLAFGVHGNESSSAEAAMSVAASLLRDPDAQKLLDDVVVVIDPLQNPDGRERYIQWYTRTQGIEADPNPDAFEHSEPWPGGRANHYLIDMNRDWAWSSQRETQARIAAYRRWNPQVFVDFHEMFYQSSYFFPPDAKPLNANLPKDVEKWLDVFGRANADAFTRRGWPFFVGETFDLFYPGYGDSWPSLHGAIGMTYEVAGHGRAGTAVLRDDATVYTLADRIARHATSGLATVRTTAAHHEELLQYTYNAMRLQADGGKNTYLLLAGSPNFDDLMAMLGRQGIKINVLTNPVTVRAARVDNDAADSRTFPAGTAVISTHQPLGALAQTLLERTPAFSKGFVEAQREKTLADEENEFYDLTSWSLPLAMNVEAFLASAPVTGELRAYAAPSRAAFRPAAYGYLIDANEPNVYRAVGRMLKEGIKFSVSDDAVTVADRTFARGSVIILKGNAGADVDTKLGRIAHDVNVSTFGLDSGWTGGTAFGSEHIHFIKDPKIALIGGAGTSSTSFGMLWHTLDVDTPIPHTNIALEAFNSADLSHYLVIVLPDGSYADRLGKRGVEKLASWVRSGGTLVAIKSASSFLRDKDVDLSKLKPWEAPKKKDDDKTPADERYTDYSVPGATFRTTMNDRSFLTFGVPRAPFVLIEGSTAFLPVSHKVDNIITLQKDNTLAAGVAWPESIDRLKGSVYLVSEPAGRGQVITFADDPHYRLFWRGTLPLFLNAVLYGPSFPR